MKPALIALPSCLLGPGCLLPSSLCSRDRLRFVSASSSDISSIALLARLGLPSSSLLLRNELYCTPARCLAPTFRFNPPPAARAPLAVPRPLREARCERSHAFPSACCAARSRVMKHEDRRAQAGIGASAQPRLVVNLSVAYYKGRARAQRLLCGTRQFPHRPHPWELCVREHIRVSPHWRRQQLPSQCCTQVLRAVECKPQSATRALRSPHADLPSRRVSLFLCQYLHVHEGQ